MVVTITQYSIKIILVWVSFLCLTFTWIERSPCMFLRKCSFWWWWNIIQWNCINGTLLGGVWERGESAIVQLSEQSFLTLVSPVRLCRGKNISTAAWRKVFQRLNISLLPLLPCAWHTTHTHVCYAWISRIHQGRRRDHTTDSLILIPRPYPLHHYLCAILCSCTMVVAWRIGSGTETTDQHPSHSSPLCAHLLHTKTQINGKEGSQQVNKMGVSLSS